MDRSQLPPRLARLAHLDRYHRLRDGHEDARSDANSDGSGTRCGQCCYDRSLERYHAYSDDDDDDGGCSVARARQQTLRLYRSLLIFVPPCVFTLGGLSHIAEPNSIPSISLVSYSRLDSVVPYKSFCLPTCKGLRKLAHEAVRPARVLCGALSGSCRAVYTLLLLRFLSLERAFQLKTIRLPR